MRQKTDVRYLTELALLTALVLIMAYTPLGYLKTPWGVEVTFIVIPVAIGSVLLGPAAGGFLGLVFGLTSFFQCFGASRWGCCCSGLIRWAPFSAVWSTGCWSGLSRDCSIVCCAGMTGPRSSGLLSAAF